MAIFLSFQGKTSSHYAVNHTFHKTGFKPERKKEWEAAVNKNEETPTPTYTHTWQILPKISLIIKDRFIFYNVF